MNTDTRIRRLRVGVFLLTLIISCSCQAGDKTGKWRPRDGVLDIPVETAPREVWEASQIWTNASTLASVCAVSAGDKKRSVEYSLELGFPAQDDQSLRQKFHNRLLEIGWREGKSQKRNGEWVYSFGGRELVVGYDAGMHPTGLLLKYGRDDTQPQGGGDADQPRASP